MTDIEVNNFIVQRFVDNWFETPVEHSNTRLETSGLPEWVRLSVLPRGGKKIGFKIGSHRGGSVHVQVFVKVDTGAGRALELARIAGLIFDRVIYNTLVFDQHDVIIVGESVAMGLNTVKSGWYQVNCIIDYSFIG